MDSIDFVSVSEGSPSVDLYCSTKLDTSKTYSHIDVKITYDSSAQKCQVTAG